MAALADGSALLWRLTAAASCRQPRNVLIRAGRKLGVRAQRDAFEFPSAVRLLEQRTDTYIFLCVLAYHLLISIEKTLLDNGVHTSWRDILKTHQICTVVLPTDDGSCLRIRKAATPDPDVPQLTATSTARPAWREDVRTRRRLLIPIFLADQA